MTKSKIAAAYLSLLDSNGHTAARQNKASLVALLGCAHLCRFMGKPTCPARHISTGAEQELCCLQEKEEKRQLEAKIDAMQSQLLQGGNKPEETPALRALLVHEQRRIRGGPPALPHSPTMPVSTL